MRFPAKITSSCRTCWLSFFTLVCLWWGRTVSRAGGRCTVTGLPNFLGWVDYFILLPMVLRWRASRARAPLSLLFSFNTTSESFVEDHSLSLLTEYTSQVEANYVFFSIFRLNWVSKLHFRNFQLGLKRIYLTIVDDNLQLKKEL